MKVTMFNKKEYSKQYYQKNRDKRKEWRKLYHIKNKEKENKDSIEYQQKNKEHCSEVKKQWYENNPEYNKQWRLNNPEYDRINSEKINKRRREHRKNNGDSQREYERNRRSGNLKVNLSERTSNAIRRTLKDEKKGRHWEDLVGYKLDDLIKHLQKTLPEGYTWNDVLDGKLHIDHKIPISAFNFTKPEHVDFQRCWELSNLRLLPARENISKSNKLYKPFQPSLAI